MRWNLEVCSLALLGALACAPVPTLEVCPPTSADPSASPPAPQVATAPPVEEAPPELPPLVVWQLSPTEPLIATYVDAECRVWSYETGTFVGSEPYDDAGPCASWPRQDLVDVERLGAADGQLWLDIYGDPFQAPNIVTIQPEHGDEPLGTLACQSDELPLAAAFAPADRRAAILLADPLAIEIWDVDARRRLRRERITTSAEPRSSMLGWGPEGIVLIVEVDRALPCEVGVDLYCHLGRDGRAKLFDTIALESHIWADEAADVVVDADFYVGARPQFMASDPQLRFVFMILSRAAPPHYEVVEELVAISPIGEVAAMSVRADPTEG